MSQLLRVQNFMLSSGRVRRRRGPEPRTALRARQPGRPGLVGGRHRELAEPDRSRRHPEGSTTTSPATSPGTSAPRSWAATSSAPSGARGRTSTGRAGGATPRRSTPRCSCSPTTCDPASRWPTPRSTSSTPHRPRRCGRRKDAADGKDVRLGGGVATVRRVPRRRPRRHHARRRRADRARPRRATLDLPRATCSTASTSRPCPAPAASPTCSSGAGDRSSSRPRSPTVRWRSSGPSTARRRRHRGFSTAASSRDDTRPGRQGRGGDDGRDASQPDRHTRTPPLAHPADQRSADHRAAEGEHAVERHHPSAEGLSDSACMCELATAPKYTARAPVGTSEANSAGSLRASW